MLTDVARVLDRGALDADRAPGGCYGALMNLHDDRQRTEAASAIFDLLHGADPGTVVAVWEDGTATLHDLGFRDWRGWRDVHREPVTTFVAPSALTRDAIAARLLTASAQRERRRGWS